jgi:hypothetical protein
MCYGNSLQDAKFGVRTDLVETSVVHKHPYGSLGSWRVPYKVWKWCHKFSDLTGIGKVDQKSLYGPMEWIE